MKRLFCFLLSALLILGVCGCSSSPSENSATSKAQSSTVSSPESSLSDSSVIEENFSSPAEESTTSEVSSEPQENTDRLATLKELSSGDEVNIVGQKANSTLVNENTIWVQVIEGTDTFVYHCQLKDEFLEEASELKMLDVVKVKGLFLSMAESQEENMATVVTLYDCELV